VDGVIGRIGRVFVVVILQPKIREEDPGVKGCARKPRCVQRDGRGSRPHAPSSKPFPF
jgi:hypothetical protein